MDERKGKRTSSDSGLKLSDALLVVGERVIKSTTFALHIGNGGEVRRRLVARRVLEGQLGNPKSAVVKLHGIVVLGLLLRAKTKRVAKITNLRDECE